MLVSLWHARHLPRTRKIFAKAKTRLRFSLAKVRLARPRAAPDAARSDATGQWMRCRSAAGFGRDLASAPVGPIPSSEGSAPATAIRRTQRAGGPGLPD